MLTPIVASDIGPVRELVDEAAAVLVADPDADALADAVLAVLGDLGGSAERATRARARYEASFTGESAVAGMAALYAEVTGRA